MATYAKAECAYCHVKLPKPDMTSRTSNSVILAGWSTGHRNYYGTRRNGRSTGTSYHWRRQRKSFWLCEDCDKVYRRNRLIYFGTYLMIAIGVVIWLLKEGK